ncbi:MAG: magnesium transporter [Thermodesulfobacterium geofontis]|uniref:Magnesium transporter n=1 Tax=Thermodesulfobacterium geofontis TaxID=1295609 RepID=A0A2N7PPI4_9BACT|nr:MAG: magnesium transporter [Thermodesulfobacterium geofontis]
MFRIYKSENGLLVSAERPSPNTWVCLLSPTEEEISYIEQKFQILPEFLRYPLDEEERPRIEKEGQQILIILRVPDIVSRGLFIKYETIPLGIILTEENIITVCLKDHPIFEEFITLANKSKTFNLAKPVYFILNFMLAVTSLYIKLLRQIDRTLEEYEEEIFRSIENEEILKMLSIEKTLTYFNTSLQGNDTVLIKIQSGRYIRLTEEEIELLEDVQIENRQAIEMTKVFLNIVAGTMDAYTSVINNNLTLIMKFLAGIAIILSIPTIIYSMYGMNIPLPFQELPPFKGSPHAFYLVNIIVIFLCFLFFFVLRKKRYL